MRNKAQYIVVQIDLTGNAETRIARRFTDEDAAWEYADKLNEVPGIWYSTVYKWCP